MRKSRYFVVITEISNPKDRRDCYVKFDWIMSGSRKTATEEIRKADSIRSFKDPNGNVYVSEIIKECKDDYEVLKFLQEAPVLTHRKYVTLINYKQVLYDVGLLQEADLV